MSACGIIGAWVATAGIVAIVVTIIIAQARDDARNKRKNYEQKNT